MISLVIDNQKTEVKKGTTLLGAAAELGIDIPTMCYLEGLAPFTSCMLCVVEEMNSKKLLPSCSALAQEGMVIETGNAKVREARRDALELLLSERRAARDARQI